jgi:hypothetical protein
MRCDFSLTSPGAQVRPVLSAGSALTTEVASKATDHLHASSPGAPFPPPLDPERKNLTEFRFEHSLFQLGLERL